MFRDEAVVLRRHDFSETSQIASLLTRSHGRRQVLAKGARRERRRGQGPRGLDLLSRMSVAIYPKRGEALDLLGEWEPLEHATRVRSRLETLDAALYLVALAESLAPPDEPVPVAYDRLVQGLAGLDPRCDRWGGPFFSTVLGLLHEFGYLADVDRCVGCRFRLKRENGIGFSPAAGGVLCGRCRNGAPDASPLSAGAWVLLGALGPARITDPARVRLSPVQATELWRALSRLVHWVAERRLGPERPLEAIFGRRRRRGARSGC